jgi:tetratricopeptide (TPR) repeat protein
VVDTAQLARKFDLDYIIDGRVFSETDGIEASIDMIDAKSGIRIGSVSSGPPVNGGGVDRQWLIASLADQARYAIYDQQVRQIQASPGDDHDVRSLLVRAQAAMDEQNKDRLVDACALIDKALAIAPDNVHALTVAAQAQIEFVADFLLTDAKDRAARLERAEFLLAKAARLDPKRAQIHLMYGDLRSQQGRHAAALAEYERVLELFPRNVFAIEGSAMENLYLGRMDEVLPTLDRAQRLGPQDMYLIAGDIAITQLTLGQDEEALAAIRKAVTVDSADPWVWAYSAGLLQLTGHREEAQAALATLRRINPTMTVAKLQLADADTSPRYHDAQERLYAALKEAGLAEGDTR